MQQVRAQKQTMRSTVYRSVLRYTLTHTYNYKVQRAATCEYLIGVLVLQRAQPLQVLVLHFVEFALLSLPQLRLPRLEDIAELLHTIAHT